MLDGVVTDAVEARSLSLNPQHIQIYSASWVSGEKTDAFNIYFINSTAISYQCTISWQRFRAMCARCIDVIFDEHILLRFRCLLHT